MSALNKVFLLGNLTRDPEVSRAGTGVAMAKVGLAVNNQWVDKHGQRQQTTDFFDLVAFDKTAEVFEKYTKKGQKLIVDGRLRARAVLDKKGESRIFQNVVVDWVHLLYAPKEATEVATGQPSTEGPPAHGPLAPSIFDDLPKPPAAARPAMPDRHKQPRPAGSPRRKPSAGSRTAATWTEEDENDDDD